MSFILFYTVFFYLKVFKYLSGWKKWHIFALLILYVKLLPYIGYI